jgi:Tfp pilus assembly protein PilF
LALGQLYLLSSQKDKAEDYIRKAIALDPKNGTALLDLASLQVAAKKMDDADRTYQQLAALPDKRYKPLHAIFLYRSGKPDAGIAELEKLVKDNADDRNLRSLLVSTPSVMR